MRCSMQDIFVQQLPALLAKRALHGREWRAAASIRDCYTAQRGSHRLRCAQGHLGEEQFHACRHRSCPRCAQRARVRWVDEELTRVLPCPHFHCIFTLPHELLALWEYNREPMIAALFDAVRGCLLTLLADPRHLGALPGLLMSLHTWGRNLSHHPHIHTLVSAGGLSPQGAWINSRSAYLLPIKPLARMFAGKLISTISNALNANELKLPAQLPAPHWHLLLQRLRRAHWNIQINPAYASARSVTLYLARYALGGPLPKQRALYMQDDQVSFSYTDHRDQQRKWLTLHAQEFIQRILWHAPPKGVHTVRHAGLYATAARAHHRQALIALSTPSPTPGRLTSQLDCPNAAAATQALSQASPPLSPPLCPRCNGPMWRQYAARRRPDTQGRNEISSSNSQPHFTTAAPGPTQRSNGHSTAGRSTPQGYSRLREAGC